MVVTRTSIMTGKAEGRKATKYRKNKAYMKEYKNLSTNSHIITLFHTFIMK